MESHQVKLEELSLLAAGHEHACHETFSSCIDSASQKISVPGDIGKGANYLFNISSEVNLVLTDSFFTKTVKFSSPSTNMCGAILVLAGEVRIRAGDDISDEVVSKGNAVIFKVSDSSCVFSYPRGHVKMINFSVSEKIMDYFISSGVKALGDDPFSSGNTLGNNFFWHAPISSEISLALENLRANNICSRAQRCFMNGKLMEVLALLYDSYEKRSKVYPGVKKRDLNCIIKAACILEGDMSNPPKIPELARMVGINDNKLKKLSKIVLGNTIYGYLNEKRIEKASELLLNGELSIRDVASNVGFKHVGYFSKLFREKHGVTPLKYKHSMN